MTSPKHSSKKTKHFETLFKKKQTQHYERKFKKLQKILKEFKDKDLKVAALGASTKGNVTLQTWGITANDILAVGDVNPDKHGSLTPGTWIPIRDEDEVLAYYDAFVVLPWHFKEFFIKNPKFKGKKLIFPLPTLDVVVP